MADKPTTIICLLLILQMFLVICQSQENNPPIKPSEFIEKLKGCHKGQAVDQLPKIKKYLERFGYIEKNMSQTMSAGNANVFDNETEMAVKEYQTLYHLDPTGTLDVDTLKHIVKPRCGFPDIVRDKNGVPLGGMLQAQQHSSSLHTVQRYAFFPQERKWDKFNLTYGFNGVPKNIVGKKTFELAIRKALRRWAKVTEFTFTEAKPGKVPDIEIGFRRKQHDDQFPFDGSSGTLAHALSPPFGKFHYDADEKWSVAPNKAKQEFDLETIAQHELGHILGLYHSDIPESIMYSEIGAGLIKRELHRDDIIGIRALYGLSLEGISVV